MKIECQYCPVVSANLTEAVKHFEGKHCNKDEYVVLEITPSMIQPTTKRRGETDEDKD